MWLFRVLRLVFAFDGAGRLSGAMAGFFLLGLLLVLVGAIFGFSLDNVDRWLEGHSGFIGAAGDLLFRIACGLLLLLCAATVLGAILGRRSASIGPDARRDLLAPEPPAETPETEPESAADEEDEEEEPGEEELPAERPPKPPGWGCALLALLVGYFAWIGMTMAD